MKLQYLLIVFVLSASACQDFVKIDPPNNQVTNETVFRDEETARAAMAGLLVEIAQTPDFSNSTSSILTGLSADELTTNQSEYVEFQTNDLQPNNPNLYRLWKPGFRFIYRANTILEGLENSPSVRAELRNQLLGEAHFIRAFCLWQLMNLYGKVPTPLTTDLKQNATLPRSNVDDVYDVILSDLSNARRLLPKTLPSDRTAFLRPTYWAATALLARVFLSKEHWSDAEEMASEVIEAGKGAFALEELHNVFLVGSAESIWQIQQVVPGLGTWDAHAFMPVQGTPPFQVTPDLLQAFEPGDMRKSVWLDSVSADNDHIYYYPAKYHSLFQAKEYHTELRLSEMYLVRAEARIHDGKPEDGINDLNIIRRRAGLNDIDLDADANTELLTAIEAERQTELFCEGHRWYDLKRWAMADVRLSAIAYKRFISTDILYPVPQTEIEINTKLQPQNEGYW